MKVNYVSIKSAVLDWIEDNDFGQDEINESLLIKWAVDVVKWCYVQESLKHRIAILQVENSRAALPDDFVILAQAAANVESLNPCGCDTLEDPDCCTKMGKGYNNRIPRSRREDIVQWVQGTLEKDCHLEINLVCPTCNKTSCDCNTPAIEVDVDRIWQQAHPELYYSHFTKIGRFGNGPGPDSSYYSPKFKLMKYSSNSYFKLTEILTDCPNVNCDNCWHEFIIDSPYIEVDFDRGEVLLSYLGRPLDGDGEILIPDHPDIFEAIINHLDYKWYRMKWKKEGDSKARAVSQEAMQLRELHIGYAKSAIDTMEAPAFKHYLETSSFMKRVPMWSMDHVGKPTPDISKKYGRYLNNGY